MINKKYYLSIKYILSFINIMLFGLGSFLCFIVATVEGNHRLIVGGVFLLLFTFVNQKIILKILDSNDR